MNPIDAEPIETFYDDNQLIPMDQLKSAGGLMTAQEEAFDDIITSASFLPRLQLFGATSEAAKEGKIGQGRFGLVHTKDSIEDLGKSITCLPLAFRLKAMQISGDDVISVFDHTSEDFKRIQAESETADSGCMYGVEFLLWLPEQGIYTTYFLSSKSARREAKPLRGLIGKGATIESFLVKTKRYSWFAPKVSACSTPISQLPDNEALSKELQNFNNPKVSSTESATTEESEAVNTDRR